jgi:hypothetical protein
VIALKMVSHSPSVVLQRAILTTSSHFAGPNMRWDSGFDQTLYDSKPPVSR